MLVAARRFMIVVKRRRAREAAEAAAAKQRATDAAVQGAASRFKGMIANRLRGQLANSKIRRYNGLSLGFRLRIYTYRGHRMGVHRTCRHAKRTKN